MALVLKEKIVLSTPQGDSEVQLLFGNITSLPLEEKVDTIFVSSYPGDYSAVPSSLIGALKRQLGIEVGKLAQTKEVNLLHNFNCWVSGPLPEDKPFRHLVCFERAMMPIFNNQDTSVITPLLATGNQSHPKHEVLKSTVTAACHWIRAGLPLRCLKIVVYTPSGDSVSESDAKLITQFQQYKKKWEKTTGKKVEVQKKYDVCMSYAGGDEGVIGELVSSLREVKSSIVIFKDKFTCDHQAVWQEHIFDVMRNSCRIIAVLTPNYLDDVECLDQFNIGLCCNRLTGCDVLVPFYLQTVQSFPSYMMLIQYTDCRVRKEGDVKETKIAAACTALVEELGKDGQQQEQQQHQLQAQPNKEEDDLTAASDDDSAYDIFISYAHRTPKEAGLIYKALQEADASLKIFLDRNELRTGNVWQETLYQAVDRARLVVAFISGSYLQSTVCQEEYNIALARYLTQDGLFLIPILIEDIPEIPTSFSLTPLIDMRDPKRKEDRKTYSRLTDILIGFLQKDQCNQFSEPQKKMNMVHALDEWRQHQFHQRFEANKTDLIRLKTPHPPPPPPGDSQASENSSHTEAAVGSRGASTPGKTVAVSFTSECVHQASTLSHLLKNRPGEDLRVEFLASQHPSGAQASRLLDTADMVVVFLSDDYLTSAQHRTELHMALCQQRATKDRPVVYLIEAHHIKAAPVFPYLLPHSISLSDRLWSTVARNAGKLKSKKSLLVQLAGGVQMRVYVTGLEYLALMTAALDLTDKLLNGGADGTSGMPTNIVNLASALHLGKTGTDPVEKCLVPFSALNPKTSEGGDYVSGGEYNRRHLVEAQQAAQLERVEVDDGEGRQRQSPPKQSSACRLLCPVYGLQFSGFCLLTPECR